MVRSKLRKERFARTLKWLMQVAVDLRKKARPQSLLGRACDYLLGHWDPLTAHLEHGETRLDNNLVENAIRPSAIGKNYAECSVMRRLRLQRGGPQGVMAAFPASGVIWSGVAHEIPTISSRVPAGGRLGRGSLHNSRRVFVISALSRVRADHHRPLRGLPPGRSKGSGSTKKEPADPFLRRSLASSCSVELEAWRAPIADDLPRGLASVGIISWGRPQRRFGMPGCRMAELD